MEKEKLNNLVKRYELSTSEHDKILKQLISSLFSKFKSSNNPVAYFIIGQPGVGKTTYINTQDISAFVYINADHYRKLHTKSHEILSTYPMDYVTLTNIDAHKLATEIMCHATKHNYSFLRERAPRSVEDFLNLIKAIPSNYKIIIDVFACGNINSILSTRERFETQRSNGDTYVKLTNFDIHNEIYDVLPQVLNALCDLNVELNLIWRAESKTPKFNKLAYNLNKVEFLNKFNSLRESDNKKHAQNIDKRINAIRQQMIMRSATPEQFDNLKIVETFAKMQ